jgi:hypothetical protein
MMKVYFDEGLKIHNFYGPAFYKLLSSLFTSNPLTVVSSPTLKLFRISGALRTCLKYCRNEYHSHPVFVLNVLMLAKATGARTGTRRARQYIQQAHRRALKERVADVAFTGRGS